MYLLPLEASRPEPNMLASLVHAGIEHNAGIIGNILGHNIQLHSNSPNPEALGPGTARNSEMSVSGNSQSSTSLYIVSYRHKLLLYMYMYTTIKNTSSVTILWKILCNFVA